MKEILFEPFSYRKNIPFFTKKSEAEFRADPYEDYSGQVIRQLNLHLGELAGGEIDYPWQSLEYWMLDKLASSNNDYSPIIEVGCGCGKLTAAIAEAFPERPCYGFDFSYQLLKIANDYWKMEKPLEWLAPNGFPGKFSLITRPSTPNLQFGLARANNLPLPDESVGTLVSSFLIDRVSDPEAVFSEWHRVLRPGGQVLLASPLNWLSNAIWERYARPEAFIKAITGNRWTAYHHPTLILREPLDRRGNAIVWNCECMVFVKN